MMEIEIKVIPHAKHSRITKDDGGNLAVYVQEPPDKGKANKAVIDSLARFFKCGVRLTSGLKSRRKRVFLECSEKEFFEKLYHLEDKRGDIGGKNLH